MNEITEVINKIYSIDENIRFELYNSSKQIRNKIIAKLIEEDIDVNNLEVYVYDKIYINIELKCVNYKIKTLNILDDILPPYACEINDNYININI